MNNNKDSVMSDTVQAVRNAKETHILIRLIITYFYMSYALNIIIICLSAKKKVYLTKKHHPTLPRDA